MSRQSKEARGRGRQRAPRVAMKGDAKQNLQLPPPREMRPVVVEVPTVAHLVSDGLAILRREFVKLRAASQREDELSGGQANKLGRYVKALSELAKEEREQAAVDMGEMTDEQVVSEMLQNPEMRELVASHLRELARNEK